MLFLFPDLDEVDTTHEITTNSATQTLTNKTIDATNTVTINASDITDQNAGTDVTADLEEDAHCSEHDGRSTTCSTEVLDADAETYTDTACIFIEDPVDTDDLQSVWLAPLALTITKLWCESDQTVNMTIQEDDGTPADIETTDLVCDTTPPTQTSGFEDAAIAAESRIDLAIASVSGTPTWVSFCWEFTYND